MSGTVHAKTKKPQYIKGIYLSAWTSGSSVRFPQLIKLANDTEINTFVIDIKDAKGRTYKQMNPRMDKSIKRLEKNNIYSIARIVVFYDPALVTKKPYLSMKDSKTGGLWKDGRGKGWTSPYYKEVWDYNIRLAKEALAMGFDEIQWDYVRFPDTPNSKRKRLVIPGKDNRKRSVVIVDFLKYAKKQLGDVRMTADVFGAVTTTNNDLGIGQLWEPILDVVDAIHPMVYPSHYHSGSFGLKRPNANPYTVINKAMTHAVRRSKGQEHKIIPWLQSFTLGQPPYTKHHIQQQIKGARDAGINEYLLWSPSNRYPIK